MIQASKAARRLILNRRQAGKDRRQPKLSWRRRERRHKLSRRRAGKVGVNPNQAAIEPGKVDGHPNCAAVTPASCEYF